MAGCSLVLPSMRQGAWGVIRGCLILHWRRTLLNKFPLAPMGALAPGSVHARPSAQPPIDTSGNFSAQVSGGGKTIETFPINFLAISGDSEHFLLFFSGKKNPQKN